MAQTLIGLDMGSHSIKVVGLERAMRAFLPVFFDEEPVPMTQDEDGKLVPYPERAAVALAAIKERGHLRGDIVATALPGEMATSRNLTIPFSDPKKIAATLPFELEASVPFDLDDIVYDAMTMRRPDEEGVEVMVGMARKESVADFLSMLNGVGVDPKHVELAPLTLDNLRTQLWKAPAEQAEPSLTPGGTVIQQGPDAMPTAVAVLDIGALHSNLVVSMGAELLAARTLLRGGQDLTRAIAKEFELPLDEAERGKINEAWLEMPEAAARYPEQRRMSDCLRAALMPLVRELRQTFQGVTATRRARTRRILLCGGSSQIPNLDRFLAAELNISVEVLSELDRALAPALPPGMQGEGGSPARVPQAAGAMALALSALAGNRSIRVDFRKGEFAHKGSYEFVLARAPQLAAGLMCLVLLGAFNAWARHFVLSRQEAQMAQKQRVLCKSILGQEEESAERCLSLMRQKINPAAGGTAAIPDRSAVDAYIQVAQNMPKDAEVQVESVDITVDRVRLKGETDSFENVDKIVKALEGGKCFQRVEKGPARQQADSVGWSATVDLDCSQAPTAGTEGETP